MKAFLITEDNRHMRGSNLILNSGETLVLFSALKHFVETSEHHQSDKDAAREMVKDLYAMFGIEAEE